MLDAPVQGGTNLSFFLSRQRALFGSFLDALLAHGPVEHLYAVVADEQSGTAMKAAARRRSKSITVEFRVFADLAFLDVPISFREVSRRLVDWLAETPPGSHRALAVDMSWSLQTNSTAANFEGWMHVASQVAANTGVTVASLYNRSLLIDEHLHVALRGHPSVLTAEGTLPNPYWLPPELLTNGTLRQQVDHWLGAISPQLQRDSTGSAAHSAEGADPLWLLRRAADDKGPAPRTHHERWKIRCFGRLRIYRLDGSQVSWELPGGATRKTKTLFAYLLQKGGQGATTEELSDLLWPDMDSLEAARNRLYHTVRSLRQVLGENPKDDSGAQYVRRDGSRYILTPPERSWIDISTFEQLCRQSQTHIKAGSSDEALICLQAADRLYTGDLFEDIPVQYADDTDRDWCWSKRYWLRDMYFKVQRDAARIYRERKDYSAALTNCHKALAIDPLCEIAHEEAMHVLFAQGRREAMERQYRLYVESLKHFDNRPQSGSLRETYFRLLRQMG
jgi:two-component SAPR family response regulator